MRCFRGPYQCSFLLLLALSLLLTSCGQKENRNELAERLAQQDGLEPDEAQIQEWKKRLREIDDDVEDTLEKVQDKSGYWRLLGLKYMDHKMWGQAFSAFEEAVALEPERASLLYQRSLSLSQLALSESSELERQRLFEEAEFGYRRALNVDSRHTPSMYALAALLVFELDRPREAGVILEDYLRIERSHIGARFLLAQVRLIEGRPDAALDLYEEISSIAPGTQEEQQARELANQVLSGAYGG